MSLLDRFRSNTEFDSVGHFTLDEKRAKDKMARFQLVQAEDFMLLICQAAVASDCSKIEISEDAHQLRFVAENVGGLESEKLSRLEDFLFNTSPEELPYYLLGVARNAIGPFCTEEPSLSFSDQVLTFQVSLRSKLENLREHLQKHLLHCPCPVFFADSALRSEPLKGSERITLSEGYYSHLFLVRYGVLVGHNEWEQDLNFSATVRDDRLRMDASFSGVVQDAIYNEIVERVQAKASDLFVQIVEGYVPGEGNPAPLLRRLNQKLPKTAAKALRKCPLFPLADRGEYVSFDTINKKNPLFFSVQRLNLVMDELVLLTNTNIDSILRTVIPPQRLRDVTSDYLRKLEAKRNKERWENSPRPTQLAPHNYIARQVVEGKSWQAEIGFLGPPGGESHVDILVQGKLLCTETLSEVPPGTAAVLNMEEFEVDEQWTRPQGRTYRTVLRLLKERIIQLFNSLEFKNVEQLYPRLRHYLEDLLQKKQGNVPQVALQAPLFETTDGRFLSLASLKQKQRVFLGDRVSYSSRIPTDILPSDLLLYSARTLKTLEQHHVFAEVLIQKQSRLRELDTQLASPKAPRLSVSSSVKRPLSELGLDGEISMHFDRTGTNLEVVLFFRGTPFETLTLPGTKVYSMNAVVQCDKLVPKDDWSGFSRNQDFEDLLSRIKAAAQSLEESLMDSPQTPPDAFLKLLQVYPKPVEFYWNRALFESSVPARRYSLAALEAEVKEHGQLLRGPMGLHLIGRLVLLDFSKNSLCGNLLEQHLPPFSWGRAEELAKQRQIEAEFRSRPICSDISLEGPFALRLPLTLCQGEVAFGNTAESGHVLCYYGGRFVCRKRSFLPQGCVAAVDSKDLKLSEDFNQATIPPAICEELVSLCEQGLLLCAQDPSLRSLAFAYALKKEASESFREAFGELPFFDMQEGPKTSLNALAKLEKLPGYVTPNFPRNIEHDEPLLRLSQEEIKLIKYHLKCVPSNLEALLLKREKDRKYLDSLPRELPEDCTYVGLFEGEELFAKIGISFEESYLVGQDQQGRTLGLIPMGTLPAVALVRGAKAGKRDRKEHPTAELPKAKRHLLRDWIDRSYLAWVGKIHQKSLSSKERALALSTLNLTKHEIGSQQEHAQANLAANLWSLPLFARVDGTWTSGASLAAALQETQSPVLYSEKSWRVPGSVLSFSPSSYECQILSSILGDKSLQAYQAPPLVDSGEIKRNIQQLSAWGISPLRKVGQKIVDWVESSPPKEVEKKTRKRKKPQARPLAPKISPEVIFLQEMQAEARNFLGQRHYYRSNGLFRNVELRSWVLGPPVYLAKAEKRYCFNRSNPNVRWLIETDDKKGGKTRRLVQVLLLIHWVALVNQSSEELEDQHEREFLLKLVADLRMVFS